MHYVLSQAGGAGAAGTAHSFGLSHCAQGHFETDPYRMLMAVEARRLPTACQSRKMFLKEKEQYRETKQVNHKTEYIEKWIQSENMQYYIAHNV